MSNPLYASNKIVIQTISPVHIGSGDVLKPIEFVPRDNALFVIDEGKLMNWLNSDGSGRLASLFVGFAEKGQPIQRFLAEHQKDPASLAAYQIKTNIQPGTSIREIRLFMKDGYQRPYLAASSVKGALRSSLSRGVLLANPGQRNRAEHTILDGVRNPGKPKSKSLEVEAQLFVAAKVERQKAQNYDLNRALVLHDSPFLALDDLEVIDVQMLTYRLNKTLEVKKTPSGNPLSILLESLRPKTMIRMNLTWQRYLLDGLAGARDLDFSILRQLMLYLPEYCRQASLDIILQEIDFYQKYGQSELAGWFETRRDQLLKSTDPVWILPIGWGSGYDAKTFTDLFSDSTFEAVANKLRNVKGLGRPGNSPGNPWLGPKLSPKSRKIAIRPGQDPQPMGWIRIGIAPGDGIDAGWWEQQRSESTKPVFPIFERTTPQPAQANTAPPTVKATTENPPAPPSAQTPEPEKASLIDSYHDIPVVGDRFKGEVFSTEPNGDVQLIIPGLDPEEQAIAVIRAQDNPGKRHYKDGANVLCEVIQLKQDPIIKGLWLVHCRIS